MDAYKERLEQLKQESARELGVNLNQTRTLRPVRPAASADAWFRRSLIRTRNKQKKLPDGYGFVRQLSLYTV